MTTTSTLIITASGGTRFSVALESSEGRDFLGHMEFGSIDDDGQYVQDDDEIIDAAREAYGIEEDIPGRVI